MRLMRVLTRPNVGGPARQAVALWHAHRAAGMRTLLVVGRCERGEPVLDLAAAGLPRLRAREVMARGSDAEGFVELASLRRRPHPLRDARALRTLVALMRACAPDVVHTHTSKAGWLGRWAAWRTGVPVVAHTFHGLVLRDYFVAPIERGLRGVEAALARRTGLLFAVSPSCRVELQRLGVGDQRVQVMPPAIDLEGFGASSRAEARAALGLDDATPVLGFVGRLVAIKRPDLFAATVQSVPDAVGLVIGEGPLREELSLHRAPLRMLGVRADVARLLPACDALVLSSEREGCPLAAVEAFAAGVPVVGFDVPGVRDALGPWGAGLLVPRAEGAQGLARAAGAVIADGALRDHVVARARAGLGRFDPQRVGAALAEAYAHATQAARA